MDLPRKSALWTMIAGCRIPALLVACALLFPPCLCQAARQVSLTWDANKESTLKGYRVFYRLAGGTYNYDHPLWDDSATTCTLIGLDESVDYAFVVRAYDIYGNESADSEEVWLHAVSDTDTDSQDPEPIPDPEPDPEPEPDPTPIQPEQPLATVPQNDAQDVFLTPVLQASVFASANPADHHLESHWVITRISDNRCVFDMTSTVFLTDLDVPPLVLEANTWYRWSVCFIGSQGTISAWSESSRFQTGDAGLDVNGDGIPDDQEVGSGIDLDGNAVDDAEQTDLCCVNVQEGVGQMAICAPADSGVTRITAMESTDLASIEGASTLPYELPLGLVSFRLELEETGGIARVQIHFSEPAPLAARWVKYDTVNGWQDYSAHAVFANDRRSAEIEIEDGGFGDVDGVANGIVIDPSGFAVATGNSVAETDDARSLTTASSSSSGGGGGGGCFISQLWP